MSKKVKFDGQVFNRGLLINKRGIQLANRLACDFQAQPKITELDDLTKRSQVKLAFSTKPKDAFLLKNHVDPRTVDSKYDNWIFDIDDKSLPVYLAILCPHAELVFEKIKPSEELNDLIKDSLESNNPYDKLMDIFKSHGYFLYEKVIFGYKLSKVCYLITKNGQESNTKFIDFNDFTACNDILNEWENLIRPYFDVSYLTLINGNTVKKDNLQEWVSNLKSNEPLQVIDLKLFPLYQIIDKSLQEEIELILGIDDQTKVLKVKERVLITGTVSISASTHYYRVRFPETLKSSNYKIFGKLVSQNNPVDSAVIKFQSTSISGFSVIIENFNIAEDSQIVWILIGLPSEIGYYSRDTRKIRLLSLNDNQFKYEKNLSIPLEVPKNLPAGSIICTNIIYPPSGCKTKITPNIQSNHDQTEINISIDGEKKSHCDNNNNEYAQNYNDNEEYLLQWCIISLPENQIRITPYLNTIAQPIYTGFKKAEPKLSNAKENTASSGIIKITNDFNQLNFTNCQKLADMNYPNGMYWLGYCYEYGIGVESDENKAFTYYKISADMNDSNGMYQVGYCYYLGIGVEIDNHEAFAYYLKSAEAGNSMGIWKTAICYKYGIGVEKNDAKFDEWIKKDTTISSSPGPRSKYGKCAHCNKDNTRPAWCQSCDPDIATRWTSRNKDIDDYMKTFQLRALRYEDVIELIPFDRLSEIKKIGKGGFGTVYSAAWLDGIRKVETIKDGNNDIYIRAREQSSTVALKTLTSSMENNNDFLKEFKSLMICKLNANKLAIYGITQNIEKEYLMVFQYANHGSLSKYLRNNFSNLTWQSKLEILKNISYELDNIHRFAKYIHADFHSGNILQDQQSYITDLGLSKKTDENVLEGDIYGVMPYVAPEVLSGEQQFTQAADIYGFGVIMSEMTTGQRPFDGHKFDTKLAVKICKGLRPEFAPGTPKCYIELAEKCMNSNPKKRPSARIIYSEIYAWLYDNEIKKHFLEADKVIKALPILKHSDEMYTSKIISTKLISKAIKDWSQGDSAQIKFDITEI